MINNTHIIKAAITSERFLFMLYFIESNLRNSIIIIFRELCVSFRVANDLINGLEMSGILFFPVLLHNVPR